MDFEQGSVKVRFTFLDDHPAAGGRMVWVGREDGMGWEGGDWRSAGGRLESSRWAVLRPEREQRTRREAAQAELGGGRISWLWEVSVPLGRQKSPRPR